ncbi:hypothetical protein ABH920_002030 [Catenulispora sp. EB89]|uniref:hypothetical protein n=1 Tax=Catenulispora sp. EB89 TaxID=3156257 RepID=UPI003514FB92
MSLIANTGAATATAVFCGAGALVPLAGGICSPEVDIAESSAAAAPSAPEVPSAACSAPPSSEAPTAAPWPIGPSPSGPPARTPDPAEPA